ncbi:MAG: HEAT repeat domain-containing protein [Acidobacteria bacterium]|nr:HEAT repeat domain-containing protein [Acidobacteriota bacterium]
MIFVLLFVLVPFLFWRGTWFGRTLTEQETGEYLAESKHPRRTQHALVQLAERMERGDPSARRWYPQVRALAGHELPEIRSTVAWVMGQDNQSEEFHAALLVLVDDPNPLVRRNAALSLVRFGDSRGRREIVAMLRPHAITAPQPGVLAVRLKPGDPVNPGTLLGHIRAGEEEEGELRSPLPGTLERWLVRDGAAVSRDEPVAMLAPEETQVWEALRALYLIGEPEDLPEVERYARGAAGMPARIQQQAALTAEAIRRRAQKDLEASGAKKTS